MSTRYFMGAALGMLVAVAMGCGAPSAEEVIAVEGVEGVSQELSTCTAACATGSVSCPSGTTVCSAQDNSGVTCNGTFIACPTTPPACDGLPQCRDIVGSVCALGSREPCCTASGAESVCVCTLSGILRCNAF
ncbi:hypothetical protein SAMN05443572_106505 [Myxococcus fulvus]|uniref:Lipoprotein n=1 Tax=Myxococcus fulvus TaxID=33 RepID=A0ABY1CMI5_MYXFU|nr:hypothetical protein [Myxococcus fulvus]SEU23219.1 hypothetical protein SAMN05443572_106505 [Myxococcus fulvus]